MLNFYFLHCRCVYLLAVCWLLSACILTSNDHCLSSGMKRCNNWLCMLSRTSTEAQTTCWFVYVTVQVKDRSQHLNCITQELIDSGRHLQEITDKKVDCLKAFVKHKKFADWMKTSLRGQICWFTLADMIERLFFGLEWMECPINWQVFVA